MAALNKALMNTWMAQNALTTIEQNFAANFFALQQLNAGEKMNIGDGELQVKFDGGAFWNGVGQRAMYLRAYLLVDPSFETSDKPIWEAMINQIPEVPASSFNNLFKIII